MKFKTIHIALIVILILFIFVGPYSTCVVPYSKDTLFSNMYKYEGAQNMESVPAADDNKDPATSTTQNTAASPTNIADIYNAAMNSIKRENYSNNANAKKVEGFALQPAPFIDNPVLDRYGSTPSGPQCFGKSSGYSNSLGPLCFSQEDVQLLSTRGGNISGTDSIIGR